MNIERLQLSIQTVKENIAILESQESEDAGYYLQLEHEKMVLEALEKQIPKQPDLEGDGYDENGELIYDTGFCPTCRHEFEVYYDATKYCPNCGQLLDWSETEKGGASDD